MFSNGASLLTPSRTLFVLPRACRRTDPFTLPFITSAKKRKEKELERVLSFFVTFFPVCPSVAQVLTAHYSTWFLTHKQRQSSTKNHQLRHIRTGLEYKKICSKLCLRSFISKSFCEDISFLSNVITFERCRD